MSVEQNVDCCKILCINRTALCRANIGPFHALIYCCDTIYFYFGVQVLCTVKHLSYLCYLINKIDFHPTCSESLWIEGRLRPCFTISHGEMANVSSASTVLFQCSVFHLYKSSLAFWGFGIL